MAVYEMRTYNLQVGKMRKRQSCIKSSASLLCKKAGTTPKLVGYFQADTGMINQLVHIWKFDDDNDRRAHWRPSSPTMILSKLRFEIPSIGHQPGSQTIDRSTMGAASLIDTL